MPAEELREKFIEFFVERGHKELPAASLIPENDLSVLFTTAGMQQFKRYYTAPNEAPAKRIVTIQPSFRTSDIEEVGDKIHLTFFEMLGNFSFGDYGKKEAIEWGIEFLESFALDQSQVSASVFAGDEGVGKDEESFEILKDLGIKEIRKLGRKDNFWGPTGNEGPCGPTVELYLNGVEVWNLVFNQYYSKDGKLTFLKNPGVDTGMGLERLLAILENKDDLYQTELFQPIIKTCQENLDGNIKYEDNKKAFRIIADHIRAAVFLLADGVTPGNIEQGYVLRRLIRRIIRYWRLLGGEGPILSELGSAVLETYKDRYLQLGKNDHQIITELQKEEKKFGEALDRGMKEFIKMIKVGNLSGLEAFKLYESYGFPFEMTKELAEERGIKISEADFQKELKKHQEKSRTATRGKFKSGLVDQSEKTIKYHTATHLLLAALKQVLGDHVHQKGSNITEERLRFDFSHPLKLTEEEKQTVEDLINQKIAENLPVTCEEMTVKDAKNKGAEAQFLEKYGDKVNVYSIDNFSAEVCGGPHVQRTGELGKFKITKEQSSSAGVRRIKAVLE